MSVVKEDSGNATDPEQLNELRQQAMEYYKGNGVPQKMEEVLNLLFYEKPTDVYGHLANYFGDLAQPPTISKLTATKALDSNGQPTVRANVHCIVKNFEKIHGMGILTNSAASENADSPADKGLNENEPEKHVDDAAEIIKKEMSEALHGMDPTKQEVADAAIYEIVNALLETKKEQLKENTSNTDDVDKPPSPTTVRASPSKRKSAQGKGKKGAVAAVILPDEPTEPTVSGCGAVSAVSQAVCKTGAKISNLPLYKYIAKLRYGEVTNAYKMPQPVVTMLSCGKSSAGKAKGVRDYMIIPRSDMPYRESLKYITSIYNYISKTLTSKAGGSAALVNKYGSLCPVVDKIEQGLDMIQEAITAVGLTPGKDFSIALDLAAHEIFDYEKGKYEVIAGVQKLPEDLADFWSEILTKYPSIIAVIDPTRKADKESWMKLSEKISERSLVAGDVVYHRPGLLKNEPITEDFNSSAILLRLDAMTTITDIIQVAKKMEDTNNHVIIGSNTGESTDTILADLAVGMNSRFIKIGAPCRGERIAKLNRLLDIENELSSTEEIAAWDSVTFTKIKAPTPVQDPDENGTSKDVEKRTESKKK